MGYFANGTEGEIFQGEYCAKCVHDLKQNCPIWLLHLTWNYEQFDGDGEIKKAALDTLIIREHREVPGGFATIVNRCTMFRPATQEERENAKLPQTAEEELKRLEAWKEGRAKVVKNEVRYG